MKKMWVDDRKDRKETEKIAGSEIYRTEWKNLSAPWDDEYSAYFIMHT